MAGGNPFEEDQKEDLLASDLRSDAPTWQQGETGAPSSSLNRRRAASPTAGAAQNAQTADQAAATAASDGAAADAAAPPPPLVPPPLVPPPPPPPVYMASEPPAGSAALPPGVVPGVPYYPTAPGTAGAWGASSGFGAPPPPPGAPSGGLYGLSEGDYYGGGYPPAGQGMPGGSGSAPAWTAGYPTDPSSLTYSSFEQQQGGGAPQGRMRCGGLGEQWTLLLVGIIIWPLWYVASVWYCCSRPQQADRRQKTPFILNCVASVVFTVVWVGIVVRNTWNCDPTTHYCW